jgi:hypothetical protein
MNELEIKNRATLAAQVLDNPVYQAALITIKGSLVQRMGDIKPTDVAELQEVARTLQNLDKLEKNIVSVMKAGKVLDFKKERKLFNF